MLTKNDIEEIILLYSKQGLSQKEVAARFGVTQTNISRILKYNNVPTRVGKNIKYTDLNTSFFSKIESEESAYFLGFMYADGNVFIKDGAYMARLKIHQQDTYILEKFRDLVLPSLPIQLSNKKYLQASVSFSQKIICEQLSALGCVPNKSLILTFPTPDIVPDYLIHHFLRGYSDGDGTIVATQPSNNPTYTAHYWKIVSTAHFCSQVNNILQEKLNIKPNLSLSKPKTNNITTTLTIGGNHQVKTVLDWLYKDATIYLPRKFNKYQELLYFLNNFINHNKLPKRPDVDRQLVINDYLQGIYIKDIAAKHQISVWLVHDIIIKNNVPRRQTRK